MSLMKLAPETVRLRRVAKAHALGEFSLTEYRQARREVIDNFDIQHAGDDDTQPRFAAQPEPNRSTPVDEPVRAPTGRKWMGWILAGLALLVATQLFAAVGEASAVTIPAVAERDPNPATSPRIIVETVRVEGVDGQLSDHTPEIQQVIDNALADVRQRNQPDNHGFTGSELAEVGRFLNALGAHSPDAELTLRDAEDLSALLRAQKQRRGISISELEEIAAAVQVHARSAGYFLAVAFVPSQEVRDGSVSISLLPGVIGEVHVTGAGEKLAARFDDLIGESITMREINTRLYALNQAPGFTARASFEPGEDVGETRLNLEVLERRSLRGDIALNNYGDDHTGRQRLVLGGDLINPAGRGDVLSAGLMTALDPSNQLLGFFEYAMPVGARRQLRGRLARNDFSTGSDIDSEAWLFDAVIETYLHRDHRTGLSYELGLGRHDLQWQTDSGKIDQDVNLLSGALNGRHVWDESRVAVDFRIHADIGSINGDRFAGQEDGFWDLGFDVFGWHPFDLPVLPGRQKVSLGIGGQFANTQLPSTRRMVLGGIGGARGFERDIFLADKGFLGRLDFRTPLSVGELALFVDAAYGKSRNELTPDWAHLANLGVSWDVRVGRHFVSSLSFAVPVTAKGEGGLADEGSKFFWSLRYAQ
jgi:hemolysin activation/secretion protein